MRGLLVVNSFMQGDKFSQLHSIIIKAFARQNIQIIERSNAEIMPTIGIDPIANYNVDFVLFWDKDILLARCLESNGYRLYNSASAIELCDDKGAMAVHLAPHNIAMPITIIAPFTYDNVGYTKEDFIDKVSKSMPFPMLIKESKGSFGKQVYIINNRQDLVAKCKEIVPRNMIFQQIIQSSYGIDARLYVVGGKVVAAIKRKARDGELIANISAGGEIVAYLPPQSYIDMAVRACALLGLDYGGVDILFGADGEPILCEVNSNAHFKNLLDVTGINMADILAEYIARDIGGK